ncbi:hypothetical protein, partial [Mycobacterium szulgai]|uniref:hypothetical protein n=1 Tax=Mycobacterium szulgai TaxID=1787 RepID=UPI0021F2E4B7
MAVPADRVDRARPAGLAATPCCSATGAPVGTEGRAPLALQGSIPRRTLWGPPPRRAVTPLIPVAADSAAKTERLQDKRAAPAAAAIWDWLARLADQVETAALAVSAGSAARVSPDRAALAEVAARGGGGDVGTGDAGGDGFL